MVTLVSKSSSQISFPGSSISVSAIHPTLTVTVESGVAVFTLFGTNAHDWTRDTLSFPVGVPCSAVNYRSGIASASPTSFWTPLSAETVSTESVEVDVGGYDSAGDSFSASGGGNVTVPNVPALGCAVDSASVEYSISAGQPILLLALAVFGTCTAMLRVSYTAHVVTGSTGVSKAE
jgi:hypothetical protein